MQNVTNLHILTGTLTLAAFTLFCALCGHALARLLKLWDAPPGGAANPWLRWFFAITAGMSATVCALFALSATGMLTPLGVGVAGLILAGASALTLARLPGTPAVRRPGLGQTLDLLCAACLFLVLAFASVKAPGSWDDTSYHLPVARFYLEHHGLAVNEYLRFPLFSHNVNLLLALGLMLGGDILAQMIATAPLFVASLGLVGAGIWLRGSVLPGWLAVLALFSLKPVTQFLGYAYVDSGFSLFCWAAVLAVAVWQAMEKGGKGWILTAGLFAGMAMGAKYSGIAVMAVVALFILALGRERKAALPFLLAALAAGCWWYARNAIIAGDPLTPLGGDFFGYYLWSADDLAGVKAEQATHGVPGGLLALWPALEKAGVPVFALALLSLLGARRGQRALNTLRFFFAACFLFWLYSSQVARYLAPVYAPGSLLAAHFAWGLVANRFTRPLAARLPRLVSPALASAACLAALAPLAWQGYGDARRHVLTWNIDLHVQQGYLHYHVANTLIPQFGPRMVQMGFENGVYFFKGLVVGDWVGPGRYTHMTRPEDPMRLLPQERLAEVLRGYGASMILVNARIYPFDGDEYARLFDIRFIHGSGALMTLK